MSFQRLEGFLKELSHFFLVCFFILTSFSRGTNSLSLTALPPHLVSFVIWSFHFLLSIERGTVTLEKSTQGGPGQSSPHRPSPL